MASTEDKMSGAQMSFGKVLNTISAAAAAPDYRDEKRRRLQDEELEGRSLEKRVLLDFDLNVAPPEDGGGSESQTAENGGDGQEILPTARAVVSEEKVSFADERGVKFNETVEVRDEVFKENGENRDEDSEKLRKGIKETRKRVRWNALLQAGDNALRDYEENVRNGEGKAQNRRRRPSREVEIGGELRKGTAFREKINGQSTAKRWNVGTEFVAAPPVVVRSTRGRAVAMPNKYRDSVIHAAAAMAVAEARFSRRNETRKSR